MEADTVERDLRRAGALAALLAAVAVYSGFARGLRRARGRTAGPMPTFQRSPLFFVPTGVGAVWLLYRMWHPLPPILWGRVRALATLVGALLYFPGLALILWGRVAMGEMHDISSSLGVQLYARHRLITSGPFGIVRHPMYVGGILAELGAVLLYRTWSVLLIALNAPVLVLRAHKEEEVLSAEFGEEWAEYSRRVPAWTPRLRVRAGQEQGGRVNP